MGAAGEEVCGKGVLECVAALFQQRHISGQSSRVAGNIDDPPGGEAGKGFDCVTVQSLSGRVYHDHIRFDALGFQLQGSLACVAAEKFGVFDAVAFGIVPGILHRLGNHLHTDDLARGLCHAQRNGTYAAVKIQHRVVFRDLRLADGGFVEPLCLVVVDLVEGSGGKPEIQPTQGRMSRDQPF